MKIKVFLIFVIVSFTISCVTTKRTYCINQYKIINVMLQKAEKNRDSVYIIKWNTKKNTYKKAKILSIKNDSKAFINFKKFLATQGINYEKELPYFEKQLKQIVNLKKYKIKSKKVRIFPSNTEPNNLNFGENYKHTGYYFHLSKPIFTRDGKKAIVYQINMDSNNYFSIFKKKDGKWTETIEYLDNISKMEEY